MLRFQWPVQQFKTLAALSLVTLLSTHARAESPYIDDCGLEPEGMPAPLPVPSRPWEQAKQAHAVPVVRREVASGQRIDGVPTARFTATGALSGKTVYLSPGHGFTWTALGTSFAWITQRGNNNSVVEDLITVETVSQFLIPFLQNAGAQVFPVRETDLNTALVFIDNGDPGYQETGTGFSTSTLTGFSRPTLPLDGSINTFTTGTNRLIDASMTSTASASWTASVPSDGFYSVSISYTAFSGRVRDAHYIVKHSGGESHFRINQRSKGSTWVLLGRFYFRANQPAVVRVENDSMDITNNISLDAVKIGGGMGLIDRGGGLSARPRFEESSRYWSQFAGAPSSVYAPSANAPSNDRNNDIVSRPRFSAWLNEPSDDAVYFALHTNATGVTTPTARGTQTYVYGTANVDTCVLANNYAGVSGSREMGDFIRNEVINDLRADAGWNEPTWRDYGTRCANFGELNPGNNSEMPAVLLELAFHDTPADAERLKEPKFRYVAARAMSQGIIRYFASKAGVAARFPPEPPANVSAANTTAGSAIVRWSAVLPDAQGVGGEAATSYRLYSSDDGLGWDEGVSVNGTSMTVTLPATNPKFFRVTASNPGGESFPSAVVGARARQPGKPLALVINGYDRFDATLGKTENLAMWNLGSVLRIIVQRMNDGSYVRSYGDAFSANDVGFDSATSDAFASGGISVTSYNVIAWAAGRGHATGAAPTMAEQNALRDAQAAGIPVLFSGEASTDTAFMSSVLRAAPGSGTSSLITNGTGLLSGINNIQLDDGSRGAYDVGTPDVISSVSGAAVLANYSSGGVAAVGVPGSVAFLAFPFEGVASRTQRVQILNRLLSQVIPPTDYDGGFAEFDAGPEVDAGQSMDDAGTGDAGTETLDGGNESDAGTIDAGVPDVLSFSGGGLSCTSAPSGLLFAAIAVFLARKSMK